MGLEFGLLEVGGEGFMEGLRDRLKSGKFWSTRCCVCSMIKEVEDSVKG